MKTISTRVTVISLVIASVAIGQENNSPPRGFVPLFNGRNLDGWHGLGHFNPNDLDAMSEKERVAKRSVDLKDMRAHWRVENGELVNDGQGVYLTTDRSYGDIELWVDYKTVALADSGIYLRATPQVQIWDTTEAGGKWDIGADKGSGGLWNNSPGAAGKDPLLHADKPFGEWNRFRIVQIGSRTSVWMNDKLVVDHAVMENYWDRGLPLRRSGPIQLQTHGGEIRWRNIFVRELSPEESNQWLAEQGNAGFEDIFDGQTLEGWTGASDDYEVIDGAIVCKPQHGGTLYTEQEYDDFVVRFEFRLPLNGNNGLAIRYPGKGDPAYSGMCELQILDTPRYADRIDPRQAHGSAYGMVAAHQGYLREPGTWNFQEVTVSGSSVRVELNGTVILDCDLAKVTDYLGEHPHPGKELMRGHFGFAGHSDPVHFRRIATKSLN